MSELVAQGVGSAIGLVGMSGWNHRVKRRLLAASVGGLARGEKVRVVSCAVRDGPAAIIWWEAGVLAVWIIATVVLSPPGISLVLLIVGFSVPWRFGLLRS